MRHRVYFDFNIYNQLAKSIIKIPASYNKHAKVYISVAHGEEYNNALENDENHVNQSYLDKLLLLFTKELNNNGVLNPDLKNGVINKLERFQNCISRIRRYDTRKTIKFNSETSFNFSKKSYENLCLNDKTNINNSNLEPEEIWQQVPVIDKIGTVKDVIKQRNAELMLKLIPDYGLVNAYNVAENSQLPLFDIKQDMYKVIKPGFTELEFVIEFLQIVLNDCGYYKDRTLRTTKSGIYDTEHAIYATYCTYFVTNDNRLRNRLNSIYFFLGLKTKCITFEEWVTLC